jgi:hypothetical protein
MTREAMTGAVTLTCFHDHAYPIRRLPGAWLLLVVVMAGCAGANAVATRDPVERLKERAGQYWEARIRGDLVETYRLHPPAFRKTVALTAFVQGRGVTTVLDYEIKETKVEGDEGVVNTRFNYTVVHPMLVKPVKPRWEEIEEQWVRVDGEWYRKFRFPVGEPYPDTPWNRPRQAAGSPAPSSVIEAPVAPGR